MKNSIYENGVYIYADGKLYKPSDFPIETVKSGEVVLIIGSEGFVISKKYSEPMSWSNAKEYCKAHGCMIPPVWLRAVMSRFNDEINTAMDMVYGEKIGGEIEWLTEYSSNISWGYNSWGYNSFGYMNFNNTRNSYSVRPVSEFNFNLLN